MLILSGYYVEYHYKLEKMLLLKDGFEDVIINRAVYIHILSWPTQCLKLVC